jgi:hypothetical protein
MRAGPLELLYEARAKSFGFCDLPMSIAVWANVHIIRVISTRAPTVWADCHLVIGHLMST